MINKLKRALFVFFIFILFHGHLNANVQNNSLSEENMLSKSKEITLEDAKKIAKQYIEDNKLDQRFKLNSASIYKRLTNTENVAISFRSWFFNLRNPFTYIVIIDRKTGKISFAGEIK